MAFTLDDVARIDAAIASGVLRVSYADRSVQYNSMDELITARRLMLREINAANGKKRRRTIRLTQTGTGL